MTQVMDSQVGMLSARPLHCASGAAPFAAQYQPTPSIVLRRQVDDDRYHVGHVTWTGYPGPRYDVISPQYVYGQRPASSSIRAPCGQLDPGGVTVVTADQWSYAAASQPPAPSDVWRSSSPAAIAAWSCSDDRLFSHTTRPHGLPSAARCAQLGVPRNPSADGVIPAWRFDGSERRSAAETTSNFVTVGDWTTQRTTLSPHHHHLHHHQLSYVSPLSQYPQPSHCDVSSSSRLVDDDDCDDHSSHRFGSKPTRASTSVGKTRTREKYRTVYKERQKMQLEDQYVANTYITAEQKADIARAVGLSERQVKIWFQNRRAKDRREKYQNSSDQSPQ